MANQPSMKFMRSAAIYYVNIRIYFKHSIYGRCGEKLRGHIRQLATGNLQTLRNVGERIIMSDFYSDGSWLSSGTIACNAFVGSLTTCHTRKIWQHGVKFATNNTLVSLILRIYTRAMHNPDICMSLLAKTNIFNNTVQHWPMWEGTSQSIRRTPVSYSGGPRFRSRLPRLVILSVSSLSWVFLVPREKYGDSTLSWTVKTG